MSDTITPAGHAWIRDWLARMMAKHELSARAWAGRAKMPGTTITRFMDKGVNPPSLKILVRLGEAIAEAPPLAPSQVRGFVDVPLISPTLISQGTAVREAMRMATGVVSVPDRFTGYAAVKVSSESATLAGVMPGDTVIFDPDATPEDGQLGVIVMADGEAAVLRMQNGLLHRQAASLGAPIDPATVQVLGVARHVQRDLD